jgi:hypothetical protein
MSALSLINPNQQTFARVNRPASHELPEGELTVGWADISGVNPRFFGFSPRCLVFTGPFYLSATDANYARARDLLG